MSNFRYTLISIRPSEAGYSMSAQRLRSPSSAEGGVSRRAKGKTIVPALLFLISIFLSSVFAGPNQNAVLSLDLLPMTGAVDSVSSASVDSNFWVAIRVSGAQDLDTYGFDVKYDTSLLAFVNAVPESLTAGLPNFITRQGGASAGFVGQVSKKDSTQISIANALIGQDSTQAPSGGGILALIQFHPKGKLGDARFSIAAMQLLDWRQQLDTVIATTGARLTLHSSPVSLWNPPKLRLRSGSYVAVYDISGLRNVLGRAVYGRR